MLYKLYNYNIDFVCGTLWDCLRQLNAVELYISSKFSLPKYTETQFWTKDCNAW